MWGLAKFLILCLVAILIGVAAVSLPIGGATVSEHVRDLLDSSGDEPKAKTSPAPKERQPRSREGGGAAPVKAAPAQRGPDQGAPPTAGDRPPADILTDEDRAALERLLDEKMR